MADRHLPPATPELRAQWGAFAWSKANAAKAQEIVAPIDGKTGECDR